MVFLKTLCSPPIMVLRKLFYFCRHVKNMDLSTKETIVFRWPLDAVDVASLNIETLLFSPYSYEQGLIKLIEQTSGVALQHSLKNVQEYMQFAGSLNQNQYSIKIEGMERINPSMWGLIKTFVNSHWNYELPFSCHCFVAQEGSPSFDTHTDPDGVAIYVLEGRKSMQVNGEDIVLEVGDVLWLPHDTPHRATNQHDSVMLSIGFERYHMEKLYV